MTIGDVLAAIAALGLIACSWVALLVLTVFMCADKAAAAASRIEAQPFRCGVRGAVAAVGGAFFFLATQHVFVGPARMLPWLVLSALIVVSVVGGAGIVLMLARRSAGGSAASYGETLRAAGVLTLAGLLPAAGWFVVAPLALFVSLGAALPSLIPARKAANASGRSGKAAGRISETSVPVAEGA